MNQASAGMDRIVATPAWRRWLPWATAALVVAVLAAVWMAPWQAVTTWTLDGQRLRIAAVTTGSFVDYVPLRAVVEPERTTYLDAIEGGRVEEVFVEEGAMVTRGQPLLRLSNAGLQLDVIAREAEVSEQLNNLRNTRLAIEQNRLSLKSDLIEIDYRIRTLERQVQRNAQLRERNLLPEFEHEDALDELRYWRERRTVTRESQQQDERIRLAQIEQLEGSVDQLEKNLQIASGNLENLLVRAPRDGRLTALDAELGQSKARGERLGQVDDVDRFKATAQVNEFYLNRVAVGQQALLDLDGETYRLEVAKVYPEVRNAQFQADLRFVDAAPADIRRGQTLSLRLLLGGGADGEQAVLLPNGAFVNDTGGAWVFVLGADGQVAHRRPVQLGRRNPNAIEVLGGLEPGERVVVSSYQQFRDVERLVLTD